MDRDSSFHEAFRGLLKQAGIRAVRIPPRSPNCNAHLERFHGSFKREVADRMIFFSERHLQHPINVFLEYYHGERNHQGLDGKIINATKRIGSLEERSAEESVLAGCSLLLSRGCVTDSNFWTGRCSAMFLPSWFLLDPIHC